MTSPGPQIVGLVIWPGSRTRVPPFELVYPLVLVEHLDDQHHRDRHTGDLEEGDDDLDRVRSSSGAESFPVSSFGIERFLGPFRQSEHPTRLPPHARYRERYQ